MKKIMLFGAAAIMAVIMTSGEPLKFALVRNDGGKTYFNTDYTVVHFFDDTVKVRQTGKEYSELATLVKQFEFSVQTEPDITEQIGYTSTRMKSFPHGRYTLDGKKASPDSKGFVIVKENNKSYKILQK
jgi:hypothetical protein|nr:hypothetical protein [Clostridia bacterium]